ncbi:HIT family protein [Streptomyces sp. NPDC057621]|uniref:HIT family protein n=1 Tax=Streptomyces sp. NPDC057621 TaxID=3346186 RepID=UPI003699F3EC
MAVDAGAVGMVATADWDTPMNGTQVSTDRQSIDLEAYMVRVRSGPCFVCAFLAGHPDYWHETVFEDRDHVAFLDKWPTVPGKVLVAPKAHVEHVVRDLDEAAYLRLMQTVRAVALAVESVCGSERTYLYSLGSQQGNAHLHWHIAALPAGVPYEQQQFHALMTENGVLPLAPQEAVDIAARLRAAGTALGVWQMPEDLGGV